MKRRRILIATLASGALLLSACGSDDSDGDEATGTTLSVEDAIAMAESGLLKLDDLPAGYTQSASEDDEDDDSPSIDGCEYLDEVEELTTTEAEVSFALPDGFTEITHAVWYADEASTQRYVDAWTDERTADCVERLFTEGFSVEDQGFELLSADVQPTTAGDNSHGYAGTVVVGSEGEELTIEFRSEMTRKGAVASSLSTITTPDVPVDFEAANAAANARVDAIAPAD